MTTFMYEEKRYDVKTMHTKQMLRILREIHHQMTDNVRYGEIIDETLQKLYEDAIEKLKAELSTREHVPSKLEAKEIRKQKMKEKRHR